MGALAGSLASFRARVKHGKALRGRVVRHGPGGRAADGGRAATASACCEARLVETFFVKVLKMDWCGAREGSSSSTRIRRVLDRLDALLGHPTDPTASIPSGRAS